MSSHLPAPRRRSGRAIVRFIAASAALGLVAVGMATPALAIASVFGADAVNIAKTLPASLANVELQSPSTLYGKLDGQDVAFATFYEKNRIPLNADQIPDLVKNAVVSIEDPRFYEHGGVDFTAVARAVLQNQTSGSTQSGASTITMQLVRNLRIEAAEWEDDETAIAEAREESAARKLLEMRYAIGLEQNNTKQQILTSYLNYASFGGNVYGIGAAAQYYYGKNAADLTLPEAAQLVSVFPSPNAYRVDAPENLDRAKARRDLVLNRMVEHGYIDQATADAAIATPIEPHITQQPRGCEVATHNASYFCDYVVNLIRNDSTYGDTPEERTALLRRGGLQIYTSVDLGLQDETQAAIDKNINRSDKIGAATSILQVGTSNVLAMAQNRTFSQAESTGDTSQTAINYNTNKAEGGSSGFAGGSTYKVFTLLDWLKQGHSLNERLNAPGPTTLRQRDFPDRCQPGGHIGSWSLQNASNYPASFDVRYATKNSINTGFAAMAKQLDLCDIRDTASSFGVVRADGNELDHNVTSIIGTNEVSPLTMAGAYAGISNDGTYCSPVAILRVIDGNNGSERATPASQCSQAVTPTVARTATSALQGVFDKDGTAGSGNPNDGAAIAGKTGSTDYYYDTWLIGFTTSTVQATWVGNTGETNSKSDLRYYRIKGVVGNNVRYTLFKDVQRGVHARYPGAASFPAPDDTSLTYRSVDVPEVTGKSPDEAQQTLEEAGFTVAISPTRRPSDSIADGLVAATDPAGGGSTGIGELVTIYLSSGPDTDTGSTDDASPSPSAAAN